MTIVWCMTQSELLAGAVATVTAMLNQKGGVGKTTDTFNLAGSLAEYGRRVLVIDWDPQGDLTISFNQEHLDYEDEHADTITTALFDPDFDPHSLIVNVAPNIDLLPASLDMYLLSGNLRQSAAGEKRLRRVLNHFREEYDHILIDCRPAIDADTYAALYAADDAIVPAEVDKYALRAVNFLFGQVDKLMTDFDREPMQYRGLILNRVRKPFSDYEQALYDTYESFDMPILGVIPVRGKLAEGREFGQPIVQYEPKSDTANMWRDIAVNAGFVPKKAGRVVAQERSVKETV